MEEIRKALATEYIKSIDERNSKLIKELEFELLGHLLNIVDINCLHNLVIIWFNFLLTEVSNRLISAYTKPLGKRVANIYGW